MHMEENEYLEWVEEDPMTEQTCLVDLIGQDRISAMCMVFKVEST